MSDFISLEALQEALQKFIKASGWAIQYTDGDDDLTFDTDSGSKVSFAKAIKDLNDAFYSIIEDDLTTNDPLKVLSAAQGVVLKGLIDGILTTLSSDDVSLDEMQELVNFIKANRSVLDSLSIANVAGLETALNSKPNLAGANLFTGLQTFGGGFTVNSQALFGPFATFLYLGGIEALHREALKVPEVTANKKLALWNQTDGVMNYLSVTGSGANRSITISDNP